MSFLPELEALLKKYDILLQGRLRILSPERFKDKQSIEHKETISYGMITDRTGPFLVFDAEEKEAVNGVSKTPLRLTIMDKDKLLRDGVSSPCDGKTYHNRLTWNEMLKRNNCVEIGNDYNNQIGKPSELKGDFNTRKALKDALCEVKAKNGGSLR